NYVIIPNSQFTVNELINYNSPTPVHAREISFPVDITADPEEVRRVIAEEAATVSGVLEKPVPLAAAMQMNKDSVIYQLRFWVDHFENRERISSDVIEKVWTRLRDMKAIAGTGQQAEKVAG